MNIYFGENLKNLRKQRKLTQERLSEFLGVSFQTISKWERGDTYPDIAILPDIASFFKVSVDELLGVNKAENENEILTKLEEYNNLTDEKLMWELITELKEKYPSDFRVLVRYLACLERFSEDKMKVSSEVLSIYDNIQENCTDDMIRIAAKRAVIEFYHSLSETENSGVTFKDCEKIISQMPRMRDSREMFCFYYPENHPERDENIRKTLEEEFLMLDTVFSHYFFYDERFSEEWKVTAFQKKIEMLNFIYDDGNYGKMWRVIIYNYGHLGVRYFKLGDTGKALLNLKKSAELAVKFDSLDRVTTMHSTLFEGKKFDKHTLGSTYSAKGQVKHLLINRYPLSDEFKASDEFKDIIKMLDE